jgi:ATP-dependent DNA helicase RecG
MSKFHYSKLDFIFYSGCINVPSELLSIQHYQDLISLFEHLNLGDKGIKPNLALLTVSTSKKESRLSLQSGDISMVIGTYSLISKKIEFHSSTIAVIDEQHRFGLVQRGRFNIKISIYCITCQFSRLHDLFS